MLLSLDSSVQYVKGVGPRKLEQYGQAVLDITHGEPKEIEE